MKLSSLFRAALALACIGSANGPSVGYPFSLERAFLFDVSQTPTDVPLANSPLPRATQRVKVGSAAFPAPVKPGYVYLGLGGTTPTSALPADPLEAQSYVTVLQYAEQGAGGTNGSAVHLDLPNDARHAHPEE